MAWDTERVEFLLKLNEQRFSASQIAGKLGDGVTRNAVIGKLNRMGLSCGGGKAKSTKRRAAVGGAMARPRMERRRPVLVKTPHLRAAFHDVHIEDLSESTCRFPMGDPQEKNFRYCGASKERNENSYCDYHMQLAHQGARQKSAPMNTETISVETAPVGTVPAEPAQTIRKRRAAH